ncbi:MAG TPA: hypothetical protein VNJ12_09795 [Candidatus Dormibacteraeota bacterium]|nr:hypothetical protein [Candidatus Dormibacteraeota bacterium]
MTARDYCRLALLVLAPLSLWGQSTSSSGAARTQQNPPSATASLSGSGGFYTPSPSGLVGARNLISLGTDLSTSYDDNVAQTNANRLSDTGFLISPRLTVSREDGPLAMALSYRPTFLVYRHQTAYNEQDHDLNFDANYRATDRLSLGAETSVLYRSSLLDSLTGGAAFGPGSPGLLNNSIITPFANQFENNSRVDVHYLVSRRSAIELFTTYMLRSFNKPATSSLALFQTEGKSAGLRYLYRSSPRSTIVLTSLYETFHTGDGTRLGLSIASLDWSMAVTPRLQVNLFAGPVYSQMRGNVLVPFGSLVTLSFPIDRSDWHWAAGGGIVFARDKNTFRLSASRQVTDGGGLLDAVTSDVIGESFERRLGREWTVQSMAGWQRNAALAAAAEQGQLEGEYGRITILRRVSPVLTIGTGYEYQRQSVGGSVPLGANFDRNFVYFTLAYRFKDIPLGR